MNPEYDYLFKLLVRRARARRRREATRGRVRGRAMRARCRCRAGEIPRTRAGASDRGDVMVV